MFDWMQPDKDDSSNNNKKKGGNFWDDWFGGGNNDKDDHDDADEERVVSSTPKVTVNVKDDDFKSSSSTITTAVEEEEEEKTIVKDTSTPASPTTVMPPQDENVVATTNKNIMLETPPPSPPLQDHADKKITAATDSSKMVIHKGHVDWFDPQKGYGFLVDHNDNDTHHDTKTKGTIFCHYSDIVTPPPEDFASRSIAIKNYRKLYRSEVVEFQTQVIKGKVRATHVTGPNGTYPRFIQEQLDPVDASSDGKEEPSKTE